MTMTPDPHQSSDPTDLVEAVNQLSRNTATLTSKVDAGAKQARQTRVLTICIGLVFALIAYLGYSLIATNSDDAKQNCLNANESRAGSLALWTTVLNYTKASAPVGDPNLTQIDLLLSWIVVLYGPRDCNDLSKEYVIPDPPILVAPGQQQG